MNWLQSKMKKLMTKRVIHRILSLIIVTLLLTRGTCFSQDHNKTLQYLFLLLQSGAIEFTGDLNLTPDVAYIDEERTVTATVSIGEFESEYIDVKLVRLATGEIDATTMLDDGACASGSCSADASGDEIEGDGVFTGRFSIQESSETTLTYRVVVTYKGKTIRSENVDVLVSTHLSDTKLNEMLTKHSNYQTQLEDAVVTGTASDTIDTILADLQNDSGVLQSGKSEGGQGIWIIYEGGVGGILYAAESGVKGGSVDRFGNSLPTKDRLVPYAPYENYFPRTSKNQLIEGCAKSASATDNTIESNKVRIIAAQYWDWGENDDIPQMNTLLQDTCYDVNYTTYNSSGTGSVEDFKNLDEYGIVLISSHGDSFYNGILSLWQDKFGWNWPFGIVILHTNMQVTSANKVTYEDDLKKGRLVLWYGNYGVTPDFIKKYSPNFPGSMVYMSICRGAWNSTMADAFIDSGAKAYFGYSDYVAVSFCKSHGPTLLEGLLEDGKTISDVFVAGQKETDSDPAEFKFYGEDTLSINISGLQDASFESGNISQAWTVDGDGRIITQLGTDSPTLGSRMAVISTGLGFTTTSGEISQEACLSKSVSKLIFDWNFYSEEFKEYCDSQFDDTFNVSLVDEDTSVETVLFTTSVNTLCANQDALLDASISFDKGDVWYTGWQKNQSVDISSFQGKSVKLKFFTTDVGDSIYDTAILIDNIRFSD